MKKNSLILFALLLCSVGQTYSARFNWLAKDSAQQILAIALIAPAVSQEFGLNDLLRGIVRPVATPIKGFAKLVVPTRLANMFSTKPISKADFDDAKKVDQIHD
ncbi:MAG TPA: hypothetical protein VGT41_03405 [Candidatus Babeliales bacterium]|nr:hypothetical protein [Candidatus Babeliales bacterium]